MRITNASSVRNYLKGLHANRALMDKYSMQVQTGRRFSRISEDPSSGVRAMQVRRSLARLDSYKDNVQSTQSLFGSAEKTMLQMGEITKNVKTRFIQGVNGTNQGSDREAIATELEKMQEELLSLANGQFSGRYMFGGTNTTSRPFTVDETTGELMYNGKQVSLIPDNDPAFDDASYIEIGLGIDFTTSSAPGSMEVEPSTGFKNTLVGLDFVGNGPNNLYGLIGEMVTMLRSDSIDHDAAGELMNHFQASSDKLTTQVTKMGADTQYLDFTLDRLENDRLNLTERQQSLEVKDSAEAIMDFKMQEYVYNAALQMGQRLLQPTLFDFVK